MTQRVSDEVLRRWVRTLTPGQAALCEELLELRAKVRRAEALVTSGLRGTQVARLREALDAGPPFPCDWMRPRHLTPLFRELVEVAALVVHEVDGVGYCEVCESVITDGVSGDVIAYGHARGCPVPVLENAIRDVLDD